MNAFLNHAAVAGRPERQARKEAAADRRAVTRKRQAEEAQLSKAARAADRHELEAVLEGPFGGNLAELQRRLRALTFSSAPALLVFVEASPLRRAPENVRYLALRLIGRAIARVRLKQGLPPFDDGVPFGPGDAPKAGLVLKQILGVR